MVIPSIPSQKLNTEIKRNPVKLVEVKNPMKLVGEAPQPKPEPTPPPAKPQPKKITFTITFYTSLPAEGGGLGLTASGKQVSRGMVANNHLPFGTKIKLDGIGIVTVEDRGSRRHFKNPYKLDVFVPRNKGESDGQYRKRVYAMGVKKVQGEIVK